MTLVAAIALIAAGVFAFKVLHKRTITGYKDEDYIVYDCSRPIKAKQGSVPNLFGGRIQTLVPTDQQEAKRYCRATGIE